MKNSLIEVIREAGALILPFCGDVGFETKEDKSPLTEADKTSHVFLTKALLQLKAIPVLSEEKISLYPVRKNWKEFWMLDPLDGTKEFLNGLKDFCINIALIKDEKPILGLIYAPALNELYWAQESKGFDYIGPKRPKRSDHSPHVAVSRFHHSDLTEQFMQHHQFTKKVTIGAALKFGRMAVGEIDFYPRFEGSKEWDTAAGQIILQEGGGSIIDLTTHVAPLYNKEKLENNFFIAYRSKNDTYNIKLPD